MRAKYGCNSNVGQHTLVDSTGGAARGGGGGGRRRRKKKKRDVDSQSDNVDDEVAPPFDFGLDFTPAHSTDFSWPTPSKFTYLSRCGLSG